MKEYDEFKEKIEKIRMLLNSKKSDIQSKYNSLLKELEDTLDLYNNACMNNVPMKKLYASFKLKILIDGINLNLNSEE